ncbi:MAG: LapA family protein [Syntrophobacter sp.]
MRLAKLIVTLIIIALIGWFIYDNMAAWTSPVAFKFALPLLGASAWSLQVYLLMLLSAIVGFAVGALMVLKPYLGARRKLALERKEKKEAATAEVTETQPAQAS